MQIFVEDALYVSQGGIPMSWGDAAYKWSYAWHSRYDQPLISSDLPKWSFSAKILNPKDGNSFISESLTNRSNQVKTISLLVPCLTVVVYGETGRPMLNLHLNYKPTSFWKILFWCGWCPRQFSRLKHFRDMVVPGKGFCKGITIQGRQLKHRFPVAGQ